MPLAPSKYQPGFGYAEQPNTFWQALEGVVNSLRGTQTSKAPWGMHEPTVTMGAGMEQGLKAADDILGDPRNAWIGLGPLAGMARFRRVPHLGFDTGGFNVPTSTMRKRLDIPRPNRRLDEVPGGTEQAVRDDYTGSLQNLDTMVTALQDEKHPQYPIAIELYKRLTQEGRLQLEKIKKGQAALSTEKSKLRNSANGGAAQPPRFIP